MIITLTTWERDFLSDALRHKCDTLRAAVRTGKLPIPADGAQDRVTLRDAIESSRWELAYSMCTSRSIAWRDGRPATEFLLHMHRLNLGRLIGRLTQAGLVVGFPAGS
jgi:hypothetical protein